MRIAMFRECVLSIVDDYRDRDVDDLACFYTWMQEELEKAGFKFSSGIPTSWLELKTMSIGTLSYTCQYPLCTFKQEYFIEGKEV